MVRDRPETREVVNITVEQRQRGHNLIAGDGSERCHHVEFPLAQGPELGDVAPQRDQYGLAAG